MPKEATEPACGGRVGIANANSPPVREWCTESQDMVENAAKLSCGDGSAS